MVPASPKSGVNTITGEGLAAAVTGAQVVVDVSNAPSWEDAAVMKFFDTSTRNLLAAEAKAGVPGIMSRFPLWGPSVCRTADTLREAVKRSLIAASAVPYTIVRATQFFEFLGGIAQGAPRGKWFDYLRH